MAACDYREQDPTADFVQLVREPDGYKLTITRTRVEGTKTITEVETGHYDPDGRLKTTEAADA